MKNTVPSIDLLVNMLDAQVNLHRKLLSAIEKENISIIASRLEDLNAATYEKESIVIEIREMEAQIAGNLNKHIKTNQAHHEKPNLKVTIDDTNEPFKGRMEKCRSDLLTLMKKIKVANSHNCFLLTHSLQLVRSSISLLNNLMASDPVYHRNGEVHHNKHSGRFISNEI